MSVNQISVFLENKEGSISDITRILAANNINMQAMCVAETVEFGIIRMIVDDTYTASTLLKDEGYILKVTPVVGITIGDRPGSLNEAISVFNDEKMDIRYMYSFLGGKKADTAHVLIKVDDVVAAEAALKKRGVELIEQDDTSEL